MSAHSSIVEELRSPVTADNNRVDVSPEQEELAKSDRLTLVGEMISSLAHELNQPLTAICAYIDCCRRYANSPDSDKLMGIVDKIEVQARQACEVIARVRGSLQRKRPPRDLADVNDLIRRTVDLTAPLVCNHGVSIQLKLAKSLPLVEADPIQIQQVLQNLIVNGVESANDDRRWSIKLRITSVPTASGDVLVHVGDNGRGFSAEDADRLFEPFFTTKQQGIGLGLPISQSIVRAHGGRLWATRNPEGGATFHIELPGLTGSKQCSYTIRPSR